MEMFSDEQKQMLIKIIEETLDNIQNDIYVVNISHDSSRALIDYHEKLTSIYMKLEGKQ